MVIQNKANTADVVKSLLFLFSSEQIIGLVYIACLKKSMCLLTEIRKKTKIVIEKCYF